MAWTWTWHGHPLERCLPTANGLIRWDSLSEHEGPPSLESLWSLHQTLHMTPFYLLLPIQLCQSITAFQRTPIDLLWILQVLPSPSLKSTTV